jgi:glycosyltransferase involved in cell wall biosynthesis
MNIAIFSDNFYPEISGISDSIILTGKELSRRGHNVVFVAPRYSKKDYAMAGETSISRKALDKKEIVRLPAIHYPDSPTGQSRIAFPILRSLSAMKKFKPDVIHSQSAFGTGIEALLISRLLKVPLVGTNHTPIAEFLPPILPPFWHNRMKKWLVGAIVRYTSWYYNRCVFVSAPCTALLEDMAKYGFHRQKIPNKAVSNPINLAAFTITFTSADTDRRNKQSKDSKDSLKKRFGFSPHTVLYTGRLAPEKGVDTIIRTLAIARRDIPDIMFAATGHGNALNDLRALCKKLDIADHVKFLGFVDTDTYPLIYQASDIFAIMSTAETQSLSLMYAMAAGMPVIGARAWGLPEYIDENDDKADGFLLEPGDAEGLAKILVDLFKNPARMAELGRNGIIASKRFAPAAVADIWENIFKNIKEK